MKKEYLKPAVKELFIMSADLLTGTNEVTNTDGNGDLDYGGGSTEPAHAPQRNDWEED